MISHFVNYQSTVVKETGQNLGSQTIKVVTLRILNGKVFYEASFSVTHFRQKLQQTG